MKPLEGITVLDFTQFTSGPVTTWILADLGADVIKLERPPYGDNNRYNAPSKNKKTSYITSLDHNKKSVLIDMKNPEHREIFLKMVRQVDVVVENFKAGNMRKFGCDYETLKAINPRIVMTSISGFGQTGPWSNRAAYDIVVQAVSGLMSINGEPGGPPQACGNSMADLSTGVMGAFATMAAVFDSKRTGKGRYIDLSMMDNVVALLEQPIARYGLTGISPQPIGNQHPSSVPFRTYKTFDGKNLMICISTDDQFRSFTKMLGCPEIASDPRFELAASRTQNREEVDALIQSRISTWDKESLIKALREKNLVYGEINTIPDIAKLPQLLDRNMFLTARWSDNTALKIVGMPVKMTGLEETSEYKVADIGDDTIEVLSQYEDPDKVHALFDELLIETKEKSKEKRAKLP